MTRFLADLGALAVLAALTVGLVLLAAAWAGTPTVQRIWPDGRCIAVEPPEAGHCHALPARYTVEWVAPR